MNFRTLRIEPLTHSEFSPYGDVIEVHGATQHFTINDGNTERYHDLARLDPGPEGKVIVSIFRGQPHKAPIEISMLERHPLGSQTFMPLSGKPYLAVVARPDAEPEIEAVRVFLCQGNQGVNYAAGVWHHPLLALEVVCDFLVIDRSGPGNNCDFARLVQPGLIISSS
ncbi:ureidoglycolate lyase [Advenella sp. S44]|uniref:ureidoglycolate lyase n=1 Tax=Advenella sp. S44 TaxID=1982755 RepID=UPI000C2A2981|nr:ureidoglycolate lyase [Advenella sp. S44]PJX25281.1 ureidoglycolate lyase [Advenella sp. S44]